MSSSRRSQGSSPVWTLAHVAPWPVWWLGCLFWIPALSAAVASRTGCSFSRTNGRRPMFSFLSMEPAAGEWLEQCRAHAQLAVERDRCVPDFTVTVRGAIERKFSDVQAQLPKDEAGASDFVFELPQEEVRVIVHVDSAVPAYLKRNAVSRVSGTWHLFSRNAVDWLAISSVLCGDLRQECYHRVPAGPLDPYPPEPGDTPRLGLNHDAVPAVITVQPGALALIAASKFVAASITSRSPCRRRHCNPWPTRPTRVCCSSACAGRADPSATARRCTFWSFVGHHPAVLHGSRRVECTMACRSCCIRIPSSMRSQDNDRCGASCIATSLG